MKTKPTRLTTVHTTAQSSNNYKILCKLPKALYGNGGKWTPPSCSVRNRVGSNIVYTVATSSLLVNDENVHYTSLLKDHNTTTTTKSTTPSQIQLILPIFLKLARSANKGGGGVCSPVQEIDRR